MRFFYSLKQCLENQLDITPKRPVLQILKVDFHLVGPDDVVVVPLRVVLLSKQFFFVAVFDAGRTGDTWAKLEDSPIVTVQLVSITRYIGTGSYKAHLSDEDIDQFSQAICLTMAQPMAYTSHARVTGHSDAVAFSLLAHCAKLVDAERLTSLADTCLHKKHRTFRIDFDENGYNQQRNKQHNEADQRHDAVEAPLEEEPYLVIIFLHVA